MEAIKSIFKEYGIDYEEAILAGTIQAVGDMLEKAGVSNAKAVAKAAKGLLSKYELGNAMVGAGEIAGRLMLEMGEELPKNIYKGVASIYGQQVDTKLDTPNVIGTTTEVINKVAERSPSYQFLNGVTNLFGGKNG